METPVRRRYERDELLLLSKSPLICKPEGLPPIEEWMGPAPAVRAQSTRVRTDGDVLTNNNNHEDAAKSITAARRPSLFESRHLSRSSIPEDIILGPPKMSFVSSSSARTPSGKFDQDPLHANSIASPVLEEERGESPRFERFKLERGIRSGDKDRGDKDRAGDRGERGGGRVGRGFGGDMEGGGWTNVSRQPRKSFGAEDGDRFRRDRSEREKREIPWDKDRPPKYDNFGRDRDREHRPKLKRDESSWLLDDNRDRAGNRDRDRDHYSERDHHRDSHRDNHRYNNNSRTEKDPEWMDSGPGNEDRTGDDKTARSMEEFQRWKERMKANNAVPDERKKAEVVEETQKTPPPKEEVEEKAIREHESATIEEYKAEPQTAPAVVENGVDRFFGVWSSTPGANKGTEQDILGAIRQEPKTVAKSRFTSFFAPQEEPTVSHVVEAPKSSPKPPTPANESSSEDREGFQRILEILSGVSVGGNPESIPAPAPKVSRSLQRSISPITMNLMSPPPAPSHQNQANSAPQRDPNTDFLMRLMHQSHQSQQHQTQAPPSVSPLHQHYGGPSQMPPPPPISTSPHNYHRAKNNPLSPVFDDPAITDFRRRDASPIYPRGPPLMEQHGPPAGWQQQQQQMSQPPPPQSLRQVAPPPGLARNQHHQGPPPPPPFLGPPPLGVNGPPMPFQLGPMPPNIPPNFGPPPPFFGMNGLNGPPPQMNGPPPLGYHMPFHHHHHHEPPHGPPMGLHGPPFGFPHEGVKSPPHPHGPGNTRFSAESIHRQIR